MQKFEHKLRTTLHTRSVENIMTRTSSNFKTNRQYKLSHPRVDNITTYLRKFEIDRENLNLAKRIMQCQSQHSRNKYVKQWKKTKKFIRVRSNFKPQLSAQEPKIVRIEEMVGHGRLVIKIDVRELTSIMKQINTHSLYLLNFCLGRSNLIPNKQYLTLDNAKGYQCAFLAPSFLRDKTMSVKLLKVVQNDYYEAGRFTINLSAADPEQTLPILSRHGGNRPCGQICLGIEKELLARRERHMGTTTMLEDGINGFGGDDVDKQNESVIV